MEYKRLQSQDFSYTYTYALYIQAATYNFIVVIDAIIKKCHLGNQNEALTVFYLFID